MKNDDADDSEEEGSDEEAIAERKVLHAELAKRQTSSKQPTGQVVGVIKRNWRSQVSTICVLSTFSLIDSAVMSATLTAHL